MSCIIIALNEEKHLPILLDSLDKQTYRDFEVIVADYNSEDRTREIAANYGAILTDGGNYTIGRNNGARVVRGRYLLFLDADSYLPNDFLEVNMNKFKKLKKGTGTVSVRPMSERYLDNFFFRLYDCWARLMAGISPHCAGCGIFVKRDVFDRVGGFDEKVVFAEDHDFAKRAKKYGFIILPRHMYTSVRRLDKDGRVTFVLKYLYAGLYRLFYREIDKEIFEYNNERN